MRVSADSDHGSAAVAPNAGQAALRLPLLLPSVTSAGSSSGSGSGSSTGGDEQPSEAETADVGAAEEIDPLLWHAGCAGRCAAAPRPQMQQRSRLIDNGCPSHTRRQRHQQKCKVPPPRRPKCKMQGNTAAPICFASPLLAAPLGPHFVATFRPIRIFLSRLPGVCTCVHACLCRIALATPAAPATPRLSA